MDDLLSFCSTNAADDYAHRNMLTGARYRWMKTVFIPLSIVNALNACHPKARLHLEHACVEGFYFNLPRSGSVFAPSSLHSLKLSAGGVPYPDLGATRRILALLLAFPTLRVLELTELGELRHASPWWKILPPPNARLPPIGQLEELEINGVWFGGMGMDSELVPFVSVINWHHVRRLELSYPPSELLSQLAPKLQSLKSFRAGPLMSQGLPGRTIDLTWSRGISSFLQAVPDLEEIGLIASHRTLPSVIIPHGHSLRKLGLHVGSDCDERCQLPCQLSREAMATIQRNCPHIQRLSVDFALVADLVSSLLSLSLSLSISRLPSTTRVLCCCEGRRR